MSYPKQDPEIKKYAICGSVVRDTKNTLTRLATVNTATLASYVGKILDDWVMEQWKIGAITEDDKGTVRDYRNYSRDQTEVIKQEATMYREGKLGKQREEEILKHRGRGK